MQQIRVSLAVVFALMMVCLVRADDDDDCKEAKVMLKKEINGMLESGDSECATKHDLVRFKCTAGEDSDEDEKKEEEFKEFVEGLDDDNKKEVMSCMKEMVGAAFDKTSGEMEEGCKEKLQKQMEAEAKNME